MQVDSGGAANAAQEQFGIARFAGRAGRDGTIGMHTVAIEEGAKAAKGAHGMVNGQTAETAFGKGEMAEAHGSAHGIKDFDFRRGGSLRDDQPDGVRSGVNGGDAQGSGQEIYCQRCTNE